MARTSKDDQAGQIMSVGEVARYLKIPVPTVYRLAQQGRIPATKVGRHWRFHRGALDTFVATGQMPQGDEQR
jgi:excisionase family DNA binding protein